MIISHTITKQRLLTSESFMAVTYFLYTHKIMENVSCYLNSSTINVVLDVYFISPALVSVENKDITCNKDSHVTPGGLQPECAPSLKA